MAACAQQFTFDILGDENRDRQALDCGVFLRAVLNNDRTIAQLVQFLGVKLYGLVARIALRKKQFGRALDASRQLANEEDFPFPASTQLRDHLILARENAAGFEVETVEIDAFCRHGRHSSGYPRLVTNAYTGETLA